MTNRKTRDLSDADDHTIVARVLSPQADLALTQPYLCIVHPREKANRYRITEKGLVLGRGTDADVFISDAKVSRKHSAIHFKNGVVTLEDMTSTNGTLVDGEFIEKTELLPSSRIRLGAFVLRLEYRAPYEVKAENQILEAARTDEMTGLDNRRWFLTQASESLEKALKGNHELCFVMIDIDHFKSVNDQFGHAAGDQVICHVSDLLSKSKRGTDKLARYGGEEFVMLLPKTSADEAMKYCQNLCQLVADNSCEYEQVKIAAQVSIGFYARNAAEIKSIDHAIGLADSAMYRAKRAGRNRVSQ